jgi:enoyl-CoA hydratase/carnithine racemase
MLPLRISFNLKPYAEIHDEMGRALSELRLDDTIRVVVLTGDEDGEFLVPPPTDQYAATGRQSERLADPAAEWARFTGVIRAHQAAAEMEKPVIARVNGDAMGFGQSLMFNSDIIVARQDAKICDMHLGLGETTTSGTKTRVGPPYSLMPGDGGLSLVPLYMTPAVAKEYLLLSTEYTARDLADRGIINHAVDAAKLDEVTDDIISRLLRRSADVLAWTKRVANRHLVDQLSRTLDAAVAYQLFNFRQQAGSALQETPSPTPEVNS